MPCHRSWQYAAASQTYTNGNWFFLLSDAVATAEDATLDSILSTEIVANDGYISPQVTYSAPVWDALAGYYRAPATPLDYSNGGTTTIQYQTHLQVCCPPGHTRITPKAVTQASFDGGVDTVTSTAHGYVDDDKVLFRVVSGTIDTAIAANTAYYVINATTNTFQLSVDQVNPIDLNGDGASLDAYIIDRSIDESVGGLLYVNFAAATSIAPGQSVTVNITTGVDTRL